MTQKPNLLLETYNDIQVTENEQGKTNIDFYQAIFIGKSDIPVMEQTIALEDLIDKFIDNNCIPNGTVTEQYRQEILTGLELMQKMISKKIKKTQQLPTPEEKSQHKKLKKDDVFYARRTEVISAATQVFGSEKEALKWMSQEVRALNQQIPIELITTKKGYKLVCDTLKQIDACVYL